MPTAMTSHSCQPGIYQHGSNGKLFAELPSKRFQFEIKPCRNLNEKRHTWKIRPEAFSIGKFHTCRIRPDAIFIANIQTCKLCPDTISSAKKYTCIMRPIKFSIGNNDYADCDSTWPQDESYSRCWKYLECSCHKNFAHILNNCWTTNSAYLFVLHMSYSKNQIWLLNEPRNVLKPPILGYFRC